MRRLLAIAVLCAALPGVATAAAPKITSLDTAGYPTVRVDGRDAEARRLGAPKLTENGQPVVGFRAVNLGREKSVMLLFDRSQSMIGQAIAGRVRGRPPVRRLEARPRPDRASSRSARRPSS